MFNAMLMRSRNKKGFTLMEMLIVVAIIAILVAVSFPVFANQLDNAKTQTDAANMRAAKAVAMATYLTEGKAIVTDYYDAAAGTIVDTKADVKDNKYAQATINKDKIIEVNVDANGVFTSTWESKT